MYNILCRIVLGCVIICVLRYGVLAANELPDRASSGENAESQSQGLEEHHPPDTNRTPELSASIETQLSPPPLEKEVIVNDAADSSPDGNAIKNVDFTNDQQQQDNIHPVDEGGKVDATGETEKVEEGGVKSLDGVPGDGATPSSHGDSGFVIHDQQQQHKLEQGKQQPDNGGGAVGGDADVVGVPTTSQPTDVNGTDTAAGGEALSQPPPATPATAAPVVDIQASATGQATDGRPLQGTEGNAAGLDGSQTKTPGQQMDPSRSDPYLETEPSTTTDLPRGVGGMALETLGEGDVVRISPHTLKDQAGGGDGVGKVHGGGDGLTGAGEGLEEGKKSERTEDALPTFDKWSVQYLAEQERQKVEKETEQMLDPTVGQKLKKLRLNFASKLCGAKVVASNPEAENTDKLLVNNPDEYMISPCKAKKWFVVELCEPLQIHRVELGTMELFSSPPKSFQVFASHRYPPKEWSPLGKFEMTGKRSIQSFSTTVTAEFVKYIRVELLEHHGDEHYCPITAFRVLGLDMASDDDEDTDSEEIYTQGEQGEEGVELDNEESVSVSLFDKTKDTVVNVVKKLLYTGDDDKAEKGDQEATKQQDDLQKKQSSLDTNTTSDSPLNKGAEEGGSSPSSNEKTSGPTADSPPPGRVDEPKGGLNLESQQLDKQDEGLQKEPVVKGDPEEIPIITKLADTEQLPTEDKEAPVVIKLEGGSKERRDKKSSGRVRRRECGASCWRNEDKLSYLGFLAARSSDYCTKGGEESSLMKGVADDPIIPLPKPVVRDRQSQQAEDRTKADTKADGKQAGAKGQSADSDLETTMSDLPQQGTWEAVPSLQTPSSDQWKDQSEENSKKEPVPEGSTGDDLGGNQDQQQREQAVSSQTTQFTSADKSTPTTEALEPSSLSPDGRASPKDASVITPVLDIEQSRVKVNEMGSTDVTETVFLKVSPSPTTSSLEAVENTYLPETATPDKVVQENNKPAPSVPDKAATPTKLPSASHENNNNGEAAPTQGNAGGSKVGVGGVGNRTKASQPTPSPTPTQTGGGGKAGGRQVDLVKVPMTSGSKRDASVMKLNNRIVALEQNVSMAKRYLEELSKAFKQQNEDMMTLVNSTFGKFKTQMVLADERDLHQQTQIDLLNQRMTNLTSIVASMRGQMDIMGQELHNKQLILSLVQAVLFLWMIISSFRSRRRNSDDAISDHKFLLDTMPSQPQVVDGEMVDSGRSVVRRNSDVGHTGAGLMNVEPGPLKRQSSDTDLVLSSSPTIPSALSCTQNGAGFERGSSQSSKKRKKKKVKLLQQQRESVLPTADHLDTSAISSPFITSSTLPSSKSPTQTSSFNSQAGVLFGTCVTTATDCFALPNDSVKSAVSPFKGSSVSSSQALKENLPLNSLGIIPKQDRNSPDKGNGMFSSSRSPPASPNKSLLQYAVGSVTPTRDKSLSPPLGSLENVLQSGLPLRLQGSSPEKENGSGGGGGVSLTNSPEFKLPSYHRNKLRKMGGRFLDSSSEALTLVRKGKGVQKRGGSSFALSGLKSKDSSSSPPKSIMDNLLDEETLLSQNRFQLPFSPSKLESFRNSQGNSNNSSNVLSQDLAARLSVHHGQSLVNGNYYHHHHHPSILLNDSSFGIPVGVQQRLSAVPSQLVSSSLLSSAPVLLHTSPVQLPLQSQLTTSVPSISSSHGRFLPSTNHPPPPSLQSFNPRSHLYGNIGSPLLPSNSMTPSFSQSPYPFHTKPSISPPPPPSPSPPPALQRCTLSLNSSALPMGKKDRRHPPPPPPPLPPPPSSSQHRSSQSPPFTKDKSEPKESTTTSLPSLNPTTFTKKNRNSHHSHRRQGSYPLEEQTQQSTYDKSRASPDTKVVAGKSASSSMVPPSSTHAQAPSCMPKIKKSGSCSSMLWGRSKGGKPAMQVETAKTDGLSPPTNMGKRNSAHC